MVAYCFIKTRFYDQILKYTFDGDSWFECVGGLNLHPNSLWLINGHPEIANCCINGDFPWEIVKQYCLA